MAACMRPWTLEPPSARFSLPQRMYSSISSCVYSVMALPLQVEESAPLGNCSTVYWSSQGQAASAYSSFPSSFAPRISVRMG